MRGNEITLDGDPAQVDAAQRLIEELLQMVRNGHDLGPVDVDSSARILEGDRDSHPAELLGQSILTAKGKSIRPKTLGQKAYVEAIDHNTITFGIGPAGTGKTYLAMAKAVQALTRKQVSRIILTRPAVEAGERLGYLPGTLTDKIDPYLRPLYDALNEMMDPELVPKLMATSTIEVAPLAYMRGRTLNDSFVVLDEAQNTTPEQMKMFLTRLGFNSKMVVTGDITQVDLPGNVSGLRTVQRIVQRHRRHPLLDPRGGGRRAALARRPHRRRVQPLRRGAARRGRRPPPRARSGGRGAEHASADRLPPAAEPRRAPGRPRRGAAPMSVELNNESGIPVDEAAIQRLVTFGLDLLHVHPDADVAILFVDEAAMEQLHVQWMDEPGPTDVLSFPMDELRPGTDDAPTPAGLLGDIVVCPQVAEAQAKTAGHSVLDEIKLLTAHGLLHLLGFDHAEPEDEREMFGVQRDILVGFSVQEKQQKRA